MNKIVAIVGRPNVGKSTLFNRLAKSNQAIVDSYSGVTRDRHYSTSDWNGKTFTVIDTGGYVTGGSDSYEKEIDDQVMIALEECDSVIFVVDVLDGINSSDQEIAKILHKTDKSIFLVVNKVDKNTMIKDSLEFYSLGFEKIYSLSAINGLGTGDFLDELVKDFSSDNELHDIETPSFAVVGRPNAGKSSFINSLIGGVIGYLIIWLIIFVYKKVRNKEGMGLGDAKLLSAIGFWFGWVSIPFVLFLSSVIALGLSLPSLINKSKNLSSQIPFGPYLILGITLYVFIKHMI